MSWTRWSGQVWEATCRCACGVGTAASSARRPRGAADVHQSRALRRLLWAPTELGFARAYVCGDVLIEADIVAGLSALDRVADPEFGPGVVVDASTRRALVGAALRLGIAGPPPRPPQRRRGWWAAPFEEPGRAGHRSPLRRRQQFYELVLGSSMTYSCAYYEQEHGPAFGLGQAQQAKCDLVAHKLGLRPGMGALDVGCGWGPSSATLLATTELRLSVSLSPENRATMLGAA